MGKTKEGKKVNVHLYSDDNPATTVKGTGFRDKETALRTIRLTEQNKPPNKRIWTINTMYYRAKHHPNQTQGMREAMEVFEAWIKDYKARKAAEKKKTGRGRVTGKAQVKIPKKRKGGISTVAPPGQAKKAKNKAENEGEEEAKGRALHEKRVASKYNKAALARCKDVADFRVKTRENMRKGREAVRKGLQSMGNRIKLSVEGFTAVFGAPGTHGYGEHLLEEERGLHTILMDSKADMAQIFTKTLAKGRGRARIRFYAQEEQCVVDKVGI